MLDVIAVRRRVAESIPTYRPALISFLVATFSFSIAGLLVFTPALAVTTGHATLPRAIARAVAVGFGPGAVPLALLAGTHALLHLLGRGVEMNLRRVIGSASLLILVPCLFSLMDRSAGEAAPVSEQARLAALISGASLLAVVATFFGAGLLLVRVRRG